MTNLFTAIALSAAYAEDLENAGETEATFSRSDFLADPLGGALVLKNLAAGNHPNAI